MKLFKNNLVFWQTDAFGTVAVNERSIITDNNPGALTLGTGGILDRYDYFTTMNGESPNQLEQILNQIALCTGMIVNVMRYVVLMVNYKQYLN